MVLKCTNLTQTQQNSRLELFSTYSELFSGKLGLIPGPTVHLKVKQNVKTYYSRAYNVPYSIYDISRKEIDELEKL
jgi:hypothetical protein